MPSLPATFAEDVINQPARAQFEAFPDEHRSGLNRCLDGLTEEQARRRSEFLALRDGLGWLGGDACERVAPQSGAPMASRGAVAARRTGETRLLSIAQQIGYSGRGEVVGEIGVHREASASWPRGRCQPGGRGRASCRQPVVTSIVTGT